MELFILKDFKVKAKESWDNKEIQPLFASWLFDLNAITLIWLISIHCIYKNRNYAKKVWKLFFIILCSSSGTIIISRSVYVQQF